MKKNLQMYFYDADLSDEDFWDTADDAPMTDLQIVAVSRTTLYSSCPRKRMTIFMFQNNAIIFLFQYISEFYIFFYS